MPDAPNRRFDHLRIDRFFEARGYRPPARPFPRKLPKRDPIVHGAALWSEWSPILENFREAEAAQEDVADIREHGLVIELVLAPDTIIEPAMLEREKYGLQLLVIKREKRDVAVSPDEPARRRPKTENVERQTWFVPNGQIAQFEHLLRVYAGMTEGTAAASVVACIEHIGPAAFEQLWTDLVPAPGDEDVTWFEVWLRAPSADTREIILRQFVAEATRGGLRVGDARLRLRDHTVVMVRGTRRQLTRSTALLACIAEIRAGRDFAEFIQNLRVVEQAEWGRELLGRIDPPDDSLAICVLDTGVNRGHPLLERFLASGDAITIKDSWGAGDDHGRQRSPQGGHGTPVAGIALFADVAAHVATRERILPPAILESAKIIPPSLDTEEERHAAAFTEQGVYLAEARHTNRRRIFCLTSYWSGPNDGRPSAWSAVLDRLAAGEDRDDLVRRLFVVAAGNVSEEEWHQYPQANRDTCCQIPAQAWNALVVGAYTAKREPPSSPTYGHEIAPVGGISPTSATTVMWGDAMWPYRPDIVFEGGNANLPPGAAGPDMPPELLPMSTAADFRSAWFTSFGATSAATPMAANFAARLMRAHPDYWPETIRGLLVHSARWTQAMEDAVPQSVNGRAVVKDILRCVGYGVPSAELAEASASHRATLIAQAELQPFRRDGIQVKPNQMHVYSLPWPTAALRDLRERFLGDADKVRMRITLSYFVQPNPGDRGYTSAYRYASCQLRFRVSQPGQELNDLIGTVHEEVAAENDMSAEGLEADRRRSDPSRGWALGVNGRTRGSLHCDWWEGPAADLISMNHLVVFPVTGWWRSRPSVGVGDSRMRYALIVTLEAADTMVDIYTEIANQIAVPITGT